MDRRIFLKSMGFSVTGICLSSLTFTQSFAGSNDVAQILRFNLSSPGRIGFYIDYSERASVGRHTFYVCRTHGTAGEVSVTCSTHGDAHVTVSKTFTWANGEADIKFFHVDVPSKNDGEHRMYAQLSNPTGGTVLHLSEHARAYGVIDDGSIATDSESVFYDADATTNGDGTSASPYNSIYDAIANIGQTKQYLYGKGVTIPDGTNQANMGAASPVDAILLPLSISRTGEDNRLYIRNWPGFSWAIDGGGSNTCIGFYNKVGTSYITHRGIDFQNLDVSGILYADGAAIYHHYGDSVSNNIELCTADNINGAANNGAYMVWGTNGSKVWRSIANNIQKNGDNTNQNTGGVYYYSATNLSVQRCEFTNSATGIFMKRMDAGDVIGSVRFNVIKNTNVGIRYGFSSAGQEPNYGIVQSNLFKNCTTYTAIQHTGASPNQAGKHWICNNVFDNCGGGDNGAIRSVDTYDQQIFNNIFYNCRKMWDMPETVDSQSNTNAQQVEYADYNHEFGTTSVLYEYLSITYTSSSSLYAASGFAGSDSTSNPLFVDATNDNYALDNDSPCRNAGVYNTDKGIYLLGIETIGAYTANDLIFSNSFD